MSGRRPELQVTLTPEQLEALAELVVAKLQAHRADDEYDQTTLPTGLSRRVYLEAARAGAFPTRTVGRRVVCTRKDLDAWIAARAAKKAAKKPPRSVQKQEQILADIATVNGARFN